MVKNNSAQTAFGAATARLMEQYEPVETRLFTDAILSHLTSPVTDFLIGFKPIRRLMFKLFDNQTDGIYGSQVCRTRYIDEKIQAALDSGIEQILILGAGFDTRAYRMKMDAQVKVFETDLARVQQYKTEKLSKFLGALPKHVTYIPVDFNTQELADVLKENQFDFQKPTFIIWEAVTQYITADAVNKNFRFMASLPAGSSVVFTYVLESVVKKQSKIKGANELMEFFEKRNSPWLFGIEPVALPGYLKQFGLLLTEDVGANWYQQKYLGPINRKLNVTEIERAAFACTRAELQVTK
jgi:methyltransferase (TIGR00027 family)